MLSCQRVRSDHFFSPRHSLSFAKGRIRKPLLVMHEFMSNGVQVSGQRVVLSNFNQRLFVIAGCDSDIGLIAFVIGGKKRGCDLLAVTGSDAIILLQIDDDSNRKFHRTAQPLYKFETSPPYFGMDAGEAPDPQSCSCRKVRDKNHP